MTSPAACSRFIKNSLALLVALGVVGAGSLALAELIALGPPNEHTFPSYYVDSDGLTLEMCDDQTDPLCPLDPLEPGCTEPDVTTECFWHESFYFLGLADVATAGGQAILVLAVESVLEPDPTVFSRVRFRVDTAPGAEGAGTYRITYPYGEMEFEVASGGGRVINFTADCLHTVPVSCGPGIGNLFTTPLDPALSPIGPYLQWDATPPAAPAGYVGDNLTKHRVTGSPLNQNFFRVEGPNIGGPGVNLVETDLFLLAGKITGTCGDGIVDPMEGCDDGNLDDGDCCSSACQISAPEGSPCDDGSECSSNDVCTGGLCVGDGLNCNDSNICTDDSCDVAAGTCSFVPNSDPCDDAVLCTVNDACTGGVCTGTLDPNCGCGDVNGDTTVTITDALMVAQLGVGLRDCGTMAGHASCDISPAGGDGACTISDALRMAQCDVGLVPCDFACTPLVCAPAP